MLHNWYAPSPIIARGIIIASVFRLDKRGHYTLWNESAFTGNKWVSAHIHKHIRKPLYVTLLLWAYMSSRGTSNITYPQQAKVSHFRLPQNALSMRHDAIVFIQWLIYWRPSSSHGSLPKQGPQTSVPNVVLEVLSHLIAFGAGNFSCDVYLYKSDEGEKRFSPKWALNWRSCSGMRYYGVMSLHLSVKVSCHHLMFWCDSVTKQTV